MHLDRPYYVSGDYLFYSIGSPFYQDDTICVKVEMYSNDRLVDSHYKILFNGVGKGWVKLPFELPSGKYDLAISAFEAETYGRNLLMRREVSVYRPSDRNQLQQDLRPSAAQAGPDLSSEDNLTVTRVGFRDEIDFSFELPDDLVERVSHVSVSVRDGGIYQSRNSYYVDESTKPLTNCVSGIPFGGKRVVVDKGMVSSPLLFAFNANDLKIDATHVDPNDDFVIELTPFTGRKRITFIDYLDREFEIEKKAPPLRPIVGEDLRVDSAIITHLRLVEQQRKINRRFKHFDLKPLVTPISDSLPLKPNYFVDVQDFDIRGTTVNLFKELISPLKFKSIGKGEYRARTLYERNDLKKFYSRPPMFIVNDAATRNGPFVAKFPLQEIKYFHIFSLYDELEKISPIAFGGLVYVDMMDPNYVLDETQALPSLHLDGLQADVQYPVKPILEAGVPATSSLLYWNPQVSTEEGSVQISFSSADITSHYLVEVVAHLNDGTTQAYHQHVQVGPTR